MPTSLHATYLRAILLKDELTYAQQAVLSVNDGIDWLRAVKQLFNPLHTTMDSLGEFGTLLHSYQQETSLTKIMHQRKQFVQHVRNKISGHLDQGVLLRAASWTPQIFAESMKEDKEDQLYYIYKSLLESAINSFVSQFPNDRIYTGETDLNYPHDKTRFNNLLLDLTTNSISYLKLVIQTIDNNIRYWSNNEWLQIFGEAGLTDFNLKNEVRFKDAKITREVMESGFDQLIELAPSMERKNMLLNLKTQLIFQQFGHD